MSERFVETYYSNVCRLKYAFSRRVDIMNQRSAKANYVPAKAVFCCLISPFYHILYSLSLVSPIFVIYLNNTFWTFIFCPLLTDCYFVDNQHVMNGFAKHGLLRCERRPFIVRKTAFYMVKDGLLQCRQPSSAVLTVFISAS